MVFAANNGGCSSGDFSDQYRVFGCLGILGVDVIHRYSPGASSKGR